MRRVTLVLLGLAIAVGTTISAGPNEQGAPLRVFLRGGPKTHGPAGNGLHDHERWVKEWTPLLTARGAVVDGALTFPTARQLENTDVLVMFAANAGTILNEERVNLENFLRRGGGIVCLHDCLVAGQDPHYFKTVVGGSWENRVAKYFEGSNTYFYLNPAHPITQDAASFSIEDEVYWDLHFMPETQVLAASMRPAPRPRGGGAAPAADPIGALIPQIWTYERQLEGGRPYRAFVSLLGHHFSTFSSPHVRAILLRGIAWAGRREADLLATPAEIAGLR
jgi:type 1 glutamine amidotransferase